MRYMRNHGIRRVKENTPSTVHGWSLRANTPIYNTYTGNILLYSGDTT